MKSRVREGRLLHACVSVCVWLGPAQTGNNSVLNIISPLTSILQTSGESAVTDLVIWVTQGLQSGMVGLSHALLPTMQHRGLKLRGFRTRYACVNTACFTKVSKRNKFRYRVDDSWRARRRRRGMKSRMRQLDRWEQRGSPLLDHRAPLYWDLLQKLLITKWASKINTRLSHDSQTEVTDDY